MKDKKPEMQCKDCYTAAISRYECPKCGYHCCGWHYAFNQEDYHDVRDEMVFDDDVDEAPDA